MKLAVAREYKQEFLQDLSRAVAGSRATRALAAPTGVAVGLAPRPDGQFLVALRATSVRVLEHPALSGLLERAGVNVDVRVVGNVVALAGPRRAQAGPGASVGHPSITAGTLGCFVLDADDRVGILSNNHVLADTDRATLGDPIWSPAPLDGGTAAHAIARLSSVVPLSPAGRNEVDAAVAVLDREDNEGSNDRDDGDRPRNDIDGLTLTGPVDDDEIADLVGSLDQVRKHGRTTGLTTGTITAVELDGVAVGYDTGTFVFDRNIEIQGAPAKPFSQGGDSGSVIHTRQGLGVGLLYAGSDLPVEAGGTTYANPLHLALSALGVRLL